MTIGIYCVLVCLYHLLPWMDINCYFYVGENILSVCLYVCFPDIRYCKTWLVIVPTFRKWGHGHLLNVKVVVVAHITELQFTFIKSHSCFSSKATIVLEIWPKCTIEQLIPDNTWVNVAWLLLLLSMKTSKPNIHQGLKIVIWVNNTDKFLLYGLW